MKEQKEKIPAWWSIDSTERRRTPSASFRRRRLVRLTYWRIGINRTGGKKMRLQNLGFGKGKKKELGPPPIILHKYNSHI